jgi:predicted HTH transcriptional regulator
MFDIAKIIAEGEEQNAEFKASFTEEVMDKSFRLTFYAKGKTSLAKTTESAQKKNSKRNTFEVIRNNPHAIRSDKCITTGLSERAIAMHIKYLIDNGYIRCEGSDRSGYWQVLKKF